VDPFSGETLHGPVWQGNPLGPPLLAWGADDRLRCLTAVARNPAGETHMREERASAGDVPKRARLDLRPDCSRCFGLCCVAPPFSASADFAIDKDAGQSCPHLQADFRCDIHSTLRQRGFPGCEVYDCFGAGQKVAQTTFGGNDWRRAPEIAEQMFESFMVMRQLHELLWYLAGALELEQARPLYAELGAALDEMESLTFGDAGALARVDVAACKRKVSALLLRAGDLVRAAGGPTGPRLTRAVRNPGEK
jgi:hypothetical protein